MSILAAINDIPLPRGWTKTVRSSALHATSVAFSAGDPSLDLSVDKPTTVLSRNSAEPRTRDLRRRWLVPTIPARAMAAENCAEAI